MVKNITPSEQFSNAVYKVKLNKEAKELTYAQELTV